MVRTHVPPIVLPTKRLNRAGIFLFASVAAAGCSSSQALYGAPPVDSGVDADADTHGTIGPAYGSPGDAVPFPDTNDASVDDGATSDTIADGDAKD